MQEIAKKYQERLKEIKDNIENAYEYFQHNYDRWHAFMRFAFVTALNDADIDVLKRLGKPQLEFNILEAYISRLRGEFSKQEPSIEAMADYDAKIDSLTIEVVEGMIRNIIDEANNDGCEYNVYTDILGGGFSVFKIWTEYENDMSFNQIIRLARANDPTLCGFDPIAKLPHKADGRYCFEIIPTIKKEFEEKYPDIDISKLNFTRQVDKFNWSYSTNKEDVLLMIYYYEKKKRRTKIYKLVNNQTVTKKEYDKMIEKWTTEGRLEQPPAIINERFSDIETICRYTLIENTVIEYVETDYKYFPLIFVDGNSAMVRRTETDDVRQYTRPYIYNAKGLQKLKNFAGQTLANELENMVQHKFIVANESIPPAFKDAYTDIQTPMVMIYNAYMQGTENVPLPPPKEVARPPIPQEIAQTFMLSDKTSQIILGSYDASLGITDQQLSGVAIVEGATQSNSAAMPYVVSFMQGLNQAAQVILDLIPKYNKTPRTVPVVTRSGKRGFILINDQGGISLNYDSDVLNVKVTSNVNFAIQKSRALQQIIGLMQASPMFAQFMNAEGLPVLLDNLEIRGIDQLKDMADQFMQNMKANQQKQMQQQEEMQQMEMESINANVLNANTRAQQVQNKAQQDRIDSALKVADLNIEKQKTQNEMIKTLSSVNTENKKALMQYEEMQARKMNKAVDMAMEAAKMDHKHKLDVLLLNTRK